MKMKYFIIATLLFSGFAFADRSIVRCSSRDHHRQTCHADTSGGVELIEQLSHASCHDNWGYTHNEIWVDNGCRAKFRLFVNRNNGHNSGYNNSNNHNSGYNNNNNHNSNYNNSNNHNSNYSNNQNSNYNNNDHHSPKSGHINILNQTNGSISVSCGHDGNQGHSELIQAGHSMRIDVTADNQGVVQCQAFDHHGNVFSSNTFDVHHNGKSYNWNINNHH